MKHSKLTGGAALMLAALLTVTGCGQSPSMAASTQETAAQTASSQAAEASDTETETVLTAVQPQLSPELDSSVSAFLEEAQATGGSPEENLETAYRYLLSESSYLGVGTPDFQDGWMDQYALDMLDRRMGNCFSFASTFAAIAAKLGYSPSVAAGSCSWGEEQLDEHAWVLLGDQVCDPLLEDRLDDGSGELHFFLTDFDALSSDQNCTYSQTSVY